MSSDAPKADSPSAEAPPSRPVVLTCAQPTGKLHLGNYLGAVRNWVALQDSHECFFGIVDLHAITLPYTPADLRKNSLDCLAQYIACGLSPERSHLFLQSHVEGHTELAWILGCLTPLGRLERMTQFKQKSEGRKVGTEGGEAASEEFIGSGLLFYPVLMAADILLYNADKVPVGEDQKQHLELTRDLASKFNATYSETFRVPEVFIPETGARIMSLQNPLKKMSKSDENPHACLFLTDDPAVVRKKLMSAVTDSDRTIAASAEKPGITNLLNILAALTSTSVGDLETRFAGATYADFKAAVAETAVAVLSPIRERYLAIKDDRKQLTEILKAGADAAQKRARRTLSKVRRKAGFVEKP